MDIEERLMVTEEEKELQEELDEVLQKLQEISLSHPEGDETAALANSTVVEEDALSFPTLIPVLKALDQSVRHGQAAQEMAMMEFVQLTTSSAKLERMAKNLGQTISKLLEGQIGKPEAQEAEWQAACKDLILDMEQVFDQIKVSGLPKSIVDKFWQEKQLEIRAAQSAVQDSHDKRAKKAQRENKKMEIKLEASIQEQENKKKQLLLGIEALWARAQAAAQGPGDDKQASPRGRATVVPSVPPPAPAVGRQTLTRASMLGGPAGAVMERILQSHRADIANGHQRRKDILEDIRKLQEKIKELEPPEKPPHRDSAVADPADADAASTAVAEAATEDAQRADPGEASEELTVDWLGLNSRIGKDKEHPDASSSPGASGRSTPSGAPGLPGGGAHEGGETIEEESSSSSSEEERPVLQMDPWILAFPFDPPDLAKRKFEFCQQHRIKSHRLHDLGKQKKYQFLLRRHIKQEKRTLMLKQKLLLKFLTGDELQRAKNEMKKGPADLKAEAEAERGKLKDRQMMIAKLLTFWQRRMKSLEEDQEAEREAFRMKVKALLQDIHSLAVVLESAAMSRKRRRRVDAEDLLRLRRQKAEEAARQQVEEERESMNTTQALKAARETEGQGSMTALQKMAAFARNMQPSSERMQEDDAVERLRLAKMLRTFMDSKTCDAADDDAPPPPRGFQPRGGGALRRPSIGRRPSGRRSTETLDDELQISATHFHRQGSPRGAGGDEEVPTQTLSLGDEEPGDKPKGSSSLRKGFGLTSTPSRRGTRVTAKRKPSVAQRDSIFANPAALSRRITGDAAAANRTATIEVTLAGGVSSSEPSSGTKTLTPAVLPALTREGENDAGTESQPVAPMALVAETWTLGDVPNRPLSTNFGGLKGSLAVKPKGKADAGRLRRPSSRSSSPEGLRRPSTVRKSISRPSEKLQHESSQVTLSVGAEKRNSLMQGGLQTPDPRHGKSPGSRPDSPEEASGPPSRRGSEREVDQDEVRAEMFLKATYMHLGGIRTHAVHPALRTQKAALSDALFCAEGERLFRRLVAQIMDLAPEMALKVVRNILNTERGRCLYIIKNSLIHQARLELEASQRVIHILEQEPDEVQRQLAEGGPLFPLSGKPPSDTSGTSSASEEDEGDASSTFPKRTSTDKVEPSSPTNSRQLRRAGMRGFMAFASSMARSTAHRHTVVLGEGEVEEAPLLQIRSAENKLVHLPVHKADDAQHSSARKGGSKSVGRTQYLAPANMAERLREAQLAADAQGARHGSQAASDGTGNPSTVFTSSLASPMLKTMLKKNAPAPKVKVQKSSMSLVGDYSWDKVVKKFESNLAKHNFTPDLAAGQWKSHFAWDLLHDDPLSGRLPDRPVTAPPPHVKQLPAHQRRSIWSTAVARHTVATGEASTTAQEGEQDENKPTSAPMLFALAKFMSRMRNKKPSQVDNFFYVNAIKEKWQQRSSRLKLLTEDMEEEYRHVRQKLIEEKGIWLQKSRKKVEEMQLHLEEDLDPTGGFDRQKRNLRERGAAQQEQRGFDSLSFVRWKVDKQLKQAMQEAERGSRVGPVTRERTAGPPPHEPVWIAGDQRYNSNLEASKQRIAALRAKKLKDPRYVKQGRGRAWRVALNVFEYLDDKIAHPEDFPEDSESETDSQSPNSRSQSITRFTPEPGHFRRSRRRRSGGASKSGRELSILSPWMRSEFMSDEEYDLRPDTWDLRCWLQPVRHRARTATDRVFTPEHHLKAVSRKGSRSDPGRRVPEDPVLLVQQACRQLVEDFKQEEEPPAPDVKILGESSAFPTTAASESPAVMDDFDAKHSKVLEILERDSLLNQEPLDSVIEEDEEDSGSAPDSTDPPPPSPKKHKRHHPRGAGLDDTLPGHHVSWKVETAKGAPVLSMQTLTFQLDSPASRQKRIAFARGNAAGMSASASAPSLHSDSSKESLHAAQPRHGQPLSLHAMRTAAARRTAAPPGGARRRSSARYQMFDVVARPLQDLRKLQSLPRRRSLVRSEASEATASRATSRRTTEAEAPAPGHPGSAPRMTVNIDKLSKELAKRWTNVTSQEVEHRRAEMEKLKEDEGDVNLDSFFEYNVMRTTSKNSEGHEGHTAVPGSQVDQRMASRRLGTKGAPQTSEATQAAQLKVQKHLAQLKTWRSTGRAPSSPVPLPVLVPKESSKVTESKAKVELQKEKSLRSGAAKGDGQEEKPMSAVNSADQYMKGGFKDADLNRLLEQISQTDTFPEGGEDFVWAPPKVPPRKVLPQLSRGESWIKAIVRGDSPYLDSSPEAPNPRGRSPAEAGVR